MEFLIKASQLMLSLSILVVLHELGHFIPARLFGTRVEKFYLFFDINFSLFKKKIGETVYGIGWLPLGILHAHFSLFHPKNTIGGIAKLENIAR